MISPNPPATNPKGPQIRNLRLDLSRYASAVVTTSRAKREQGFAIAILPALLTAEETQHPNLGKNPR